MQTIIILEGPDMCAKTEISKELSKRLNIPRFKASDEHGAFLNNNDRFINTLTYADPRMVDFLGQTGCSVIFDRAYPSEYVYSKVLNRQTNQQMIQFVDTKFAELNTWIIMCHRSSYEHIVDDIAPNILDSLTLKKLDHEYHNFLNWTKCRNKMIINVDDENLEREINDIMFIMGEGAYQKR